MADNDSSKEKQLIAKVEELIEKIEENLQLNAVDTLSKEGALGYSFEEFGIAFHAGRLTYLTDLIQSKIEEYDLQHKEAEAENETTSVTVSKPNFINRMIHAIRNAISQFRRSSKWKEDYAKMERIAKEKEENEEALDNIKYSKQKINIKEKIYTLEEELSKLNHEYRDKKSEVTIKSEDETQSKVALAKIEEEYAKKTSKIKDKLESLKVKLATIEAEEKAQNEEKEENAEPKKEQAKTSHQKFVSDLIDDTRSENGPIKSAEESLEGYIEWLNKAKKEAGQQQTDNEQESDEDRQ